MAAQDETPRTGVEQFSLTGRVAVVTGASSGLGAGFARALAAAGADVVLAARRVDRLHDIAREVEKHGVRALPVRCDVVSPDDCAAVVDRAVAELGAVDVLVNNAGVGTAVPALRETPEEFRSVVDVNLMGAYWMAQSCARVMRPGSSIINVASALALVKPFAPQAAYVASKAGLVGLTRDLAQQWSGRKGIRVNAIAPGYFATDMTEAAPRAALTEFLEHSTPLKRMGKPHELDGAVVFLAGDASTYVTGITLPVDGGMSGH
ncbi:SDR family NAD(P)-dependent oxidoreductase [Streptomyces hirsutus]|uniref:SDR family NAD(P)-dependent oxidoreductase n=1 Tax=Streptomyces hirsutus TaxID=35620 RepID=UPI0033268158